MILNPGEKIHVVHRRMFEKDLRKHFIGVVDGFENGYLRATGHVFVIEDPKENIFRRKPELRTRVISLSGGSVYLNVIPPLVEIEKVYYEYSEKGLRVTDGAGWFLDLREFGWA